MRWHSMRIKQNDRPHMSQRTTARQGDMVKCDGEGELRWELSPLRCPINESEYLNFHSVNVREPWTV